MLQHVTLFCHWWLVMENVNYKNSFYVTYLLVISHAISICKFQHVHDWRFHWLYTAAPHIAAYCDNARRSAAAYASVPGGISPVRSISNRQRLAALIGRSDRVLRGLVLALVDLCEAAHDEKPTLVTLNICYFTCRRIYCKFIRRRSTSRLTDRL